MYCMKCGREVEDTQVFCLDCQELMKQEPIPICSSVKIPRQPLKHNKPHRPAVRYEEEVLRLEKSNERLRIWVILLAMATVLLTMAVYHKEVAKAVEDMGKNYSIVETYHGSP